MYNTHLSWVTEPIHVRLFILYLLVVICITLVRTKKLVWSLYMPGARKQISLDNIRDGTVDANLLAQSALANKLASIPVGKGHGDTSPIGDEASLRLMRLADLRFIFLWETYHADVASIKRLARLTFLVAVLIVIYGAFPTWAEHFNNTNITGNEALITSLSLLFDRLAIGIATCVLFLAISNHFENSLMRRRSSWNYFYSRFTMGSV